MAIRCNQNTFETNKKSDQTIFSVGLVVQTYISTEPPSVALTWLGLSIGAITDGHWLRVGQSLGWVIQQDWLL